MNQRGFSIVETVLYITIVGILFVVVVQFWGSLVENAVRIRLEQDVQNSSRFAAETIAKYVRQADTIQFPGPGATGTALSLTMDNPTEDPTVFDVLDGLLRVTPGVQGPFEITPESVEMTSIEFANLTPSTTTPGIIQVQFVLTAVQPTAGQFNQVSKVTQTSISLRDN